MLLYKMKNWQNATFIRQIVTCHNSAFDIWKKSLDILAFYKKKKKKLIHKMPQKALMRKSVNRQNVRAWKVIEPGWSLICDWSRTKFVQLSFYFFAAFGLWLAECPVIRKAKNWLRTC